VSQPRPRSLEDVRRDVARLLEELARRGEELRGVAQLHSEALRKSIEQLGRIREEARRLAEQARLRAQQASAQRR